MRRTFLTPGQLFYQKLDETNSLDSWIMASQAILICVFLLSSSTRVSTTKNKRNEISVLRYLYILHIEIILTLNPLNEK